MAESKEITLRQSDIASFVESFSAVPGDPIFEGLKTVYNFGVRLDAGKVEEAKALAYEKRESLETLWRRIKENEKAGKQLKPLIEKIAEMVPMEDYFKWQAGAKKSKKAITNVNELWKRLEASGVTLECFLSNCTIDFDKAVLISGKNEPTFLEDWGDVASVETVQAKAILKGLV